jgi:predicted O-methyltransferase YrrM
VVDNRSNLNPPAALAAILADTTALGFTMASEPLTGSLLRTLAASKPNGLLLELGTGAGAGTSWLLSGMDAGSRLLTVDNDEAAIAVARKHLGHDPRVTFHTSDASKFIERLRGWQFDLVFADTWAGKFTHLADALALVRTGGFYVIDDLLPQASWPAGHAARVPVLIDQLEQQPGFVLTKMGWATGLIVAAHQPAQ